jgi:hypothetical protein
MIGRAVPPDPAIAPSSQVLPVAFHASANLETAAASPPDVHQCVTSSSTADAADAEIIAVAASSFVESFTILSSLVLNRCRKTYNDLDCPSKT